MGLLTSDHPHCRRCGNELQGTEEQCPYCGYSPRERGFQLGGLMLLATIGFLTVAVLTGNFYPQLGAYAIVAAFVGFGLTTVVVILSFIAKPHHFATFFQ